MLRCRHVGVNEKPRHTLRETAHRLLGFAAFDAYLTAAIGKGEDESKQRFQVDAAAAKNRGGDRRSEVAKPKAAATIDPHNSSVPRRMASDAQRRRFSTAWPATTPTCCRRSRPAS
jgi:hypothetical protein